MMNAIKRIIFIFAMMVPVFFTGCSPTGFEPVTGTYPVKVKSFTYLDLISDDLAGISSNVAEMIESKPENLEIDFAYEQFSQVRFGSFNLGNNEQKVYFMMVNEGTDQEENFWTDIYLDQDLDFRITNKEKIKGLQTSQDRIQGIDRIQSYGLIPVSLQISYKGLSNQFTRKLYFFLVVSVYQKKELSDIIVNVFAAGFIEGEIKVLAGNNPRAVKFRIIDANSNGCFNDYGTDRLFFDFNMDGYYSRNESRELTEYYTIRHGAVKEQIRMIVIPYPAKIAIVKSEEEYALDQLEPVISIETDETKDSANQNGTN